MKILVVGNLGYIGPMVAKHFRQHHPGSYLAGFDIGFFIQNYTPNGVVGDLSLIHI